MDDALIDNIVDEFSVSKDDSVLDSAQKIINLVKRVEKEVNGLDDETIKYKYTHGYCGVLARHVSYLLECVYNRKVVQVIETNVSVKNKPGELVPHALIRIKKPNNNPNARLSLSDGVLYIDITGEIDVKDLKNYCLEPGDYVIDSKYQEEWKMGSAIIDDIFYNKIYPKYSEDFQNQRN